MRIPRVGIKVASDLTYVVLTLNDSADSSAVAGLLRESGTTYKRTAEGYLVRSSDSPRLLELRGIDIKWTDEARRYCENRAWAAEARPVVLGAVRGIVAAGPESALGLLARPSVATVLDPHQIVNVAAMTVPGGYGFCLFDEQGAGKTVSMIFAFDQLVERNEVDFGLIVAPKSMVAEWPEDFKRFCGDLYRVSVAAGSQSQKLSAIRSSADLVVTNFDTLVSMEGAVSERLKQHGRRGVLIVDESFFIKNSEAQRTQVLSRLREFSGRAYVLCGTPAPNAPQDIVQQISFVDFGLSFAGAEVSKDRFQAASAIRNQIGNRGLFVRNLKQDVMPDLPTKSFNQIDLAFQPLQKQMYLETLQGFVNDLSNSTDSDFSRNRGTFLARRASLLQICSHPAAVDPTYTEVPAKQLALDSLLLNLIVERKEKVVLWSFYRASIDAIMKRYETYSPVRFDGSISEVEKRRSAVSQFQTDNKTMLFVGNPAAAGAGLTLHRARVAIYESMSNQAAHYLQSLDRIHRRGQRNEVEYMVLLCTGSIEVNEFDRLRTKEAAAQHLLGDQISAPITRQMLLNDALSSLKSWIDVDAVRGT